MLSTLKRLLSGRSHAARGWEEITAWAKGQGWVFRGVREAEGFVIEGRVGTVPWRMEWGPSQRHYIQGCELRIRAEVPLPGQLQVLLLNRGLMETLERSVFDQYVEGVQTRIDGQTPPEMRWLVMFPKLTGGELRSLREGFGAVSNQKPWALSWLGGGLAQAMHATPQQAGVAMALMIGRSRMTLRTAMPEPDAKTLQAWAHLFETAVREAQRVSVEDTERTVATTQPSLWAAEPSQAGALPAASASHR